ncbi:MAG TPA: Na+/H+ antiporter subunit D [Segeticoccus sp.]|uniref:Na+/H+ antiporter subunit D n=1 Tax=Segeticoccus sp. TaxID=2706531 RepID=UPI002D7FAD34|nr:Na+/H+ antiporter subunit D [Segeticoccus sp.]HET8600207.1 Na+/H+ antiporter subunit D [Segeticoccus sp.]
MSGLHPAAFDALVPLPVALPLVGAGITIAAGRHTRIQRVVSVTVLTVVLGVSGALLWAADHDGPQVVDVGGWPPPLGIVLVVDRLAALMLVVSSLVTLAVLLYSIGQGRSSFDDESDGEAPLPIFHPTMMVLAAGVATTFVSGDLFHIYVGFEMLLMASFVLLTLGGTPPRVRAGVTYVLVSMLSSLVFLVAIALVYAATGTVNLAQLAGRLDALPSGTRLALQVMLLLGFAIKAAVFPMSGWLPDSYPTAPAPVTAVFAGLLTKVGVYAIIRTQTLLFPDGRLTDLLLWASLLTMLVGILGAVAQDDLKRMLSFTLVSHIGYMTFGIAIGSVAGFSSAIFYVAHHITIQTTLFLVAGLVERRGGSTALSELGGLARAAPLLGVLFFIPAMNLAGIPPFSGFLGKVGLMEAGAAAGTWLAYVLIAGSVVTSLLTLYAMSRVWGRAFWRAPTDAVAAMRRPQRRGALAAGVVAPTAALVVVGVGISVVAGPLFGITDRSATDMLQRTPYIQSVYPKGVP